MEANGPNPADPFESWLLRRVAEAVEPGEMSADLLTDLHAAIAETRGRDPEDRQALTLMDLAERLTLSMDRLQELLTGLQAHPPAVRARFLRRFVEAWLIQQRELYDADYQRGEDD